MDHRVMRTTLAAASLVLAAGGSALAQATYAPAAVPRIDVPQAGPAELDRSRLGAPVYAAPGYAPVYAAAARSSGYPPAPPSLLVPVQYTPQAGYAPPASAAPPYAPADAAAISAALGSLLAVPPSPAAASPGVAAQEQALAAFYAERGYAPVWVDAHGLDARAVAAITRIKAAAADGLNPDSFLTPDPDRSVGSTADDLARAELAVSRAALLYARQAQAGRILPRALSPLATAEPPIPDPLAAMRTVAGAGDVAAALDNFNPPHAGFQALRSKLAELTANRRAAETVPEVPAGAILRPGRIDPRVPLLRDRLKLSAAYTEEYTPDLVAAVQAFQKSRGLRPNGVIGDQTVQALNDVRRGDPTADVIANMERWRWLPRDLGESNVFVNIPSYELRIFRNGMETYKSRVVVGKPTNQTPIFSNAIQFVIVNPFWNVPNSIAVKEMLPNLRNDPGYLERQGIEVVRVDGRKAQVVSPWSIDWSSVSMNRLQFRQLPGERNALGRIKFMFPNEHAVYLHDTPSRSLFARDMRALSHGCVRVDNPLQFGEALLGTEGMTAKKLGAMVGGSEKRVGIRTPIPVHLAYFTVFVDSTGALHNLPDVYGYDRLVRRALGLEGIATAAQ